MGSDQKVYLPLHAKDLAQTAQLRTRCDLTMYGLRILGKPALIVINKAVTVLCCPIGLQKLHSKLCLRSAPAVQSYWPEHDSWVLLLMVPSLVV